MTSPADKAQDIQPGTDGIPVMASSRQSLKTVLYAEDDPDIRAVVEMTLEAMTDIELISCKGGSEAIMKAGSVVPDMVLLDVMMSDIDGLTVFDYLSRQSDYQNVPTVLITAKVQKHEVEEYLRRGVIGVIPKPFDPVALPELLEALWMDFQVSTESVQAGS